MARLRSSQATHALLVLALLASRADRCLARRSVEPPPASRDDPPARVEVETFEPVERRVTIRPGFRALERARAVIDDARVIDSGLRRKRVRGRWIDAAHAFTSPLAAVARVRDRWLFATKDGAVFEAEDFLSAPRRIAEIPGPARSAPNLTPSRGRLAVIDADRHLWTADASGVLTRATSLDDTRVTSAAFESESHGIALTEWGHLLETTDGGATFRERRAPSPALSEVLIVGRRLAVRQEEAAAIALDRDDSREREPIDDEPAAQRELDPSQNDNADCSDESARWLVEERGLDACRALSVATQTLSDGTLGTWFRRWGSSVLVQTNGYRYAQEWTRATRDARGQWQLGETIEVDGGADFRSQFSNDGRTTLTIGRCERDPYAEPVNERALCWREFDARTLRRHATLEVPARSRLAHGFGALAIVSSEDQRSLHVLDFVSRTTVVRSAAQLAPTLRDARITHVHTLLPSGRSYAVLVGDDGSAQLRMDLDRDDGALVALPRFATDAAIDSRGRTLAAGDRAHRIWRRASDGDPWESVALAIDADPSRVAIHGVRCGDDACAAGAFEVPWRERPALVQWIGALERGANRSEEAQPRWEFTTVACEDHNRIYTGERIARSEEDEAEGALYIFGPGSWARVSATDDGLRFSWAERYRNPAWSARGRAASALAMADEEIEDADDQNRVLAMARSGLLVRFGATVGWIAASGGASRVLRPRGAIAVSVVHDAGFALLRADGKASLYDLRGQLQVERRIEQPVGARFATGLARIAGRWGAVTSDPASADRARFVDARSGARTSIEWRHTVAPRVCEEPSREGADFVRMRLRAGLETREQYVRQTSMSTLWADALDRPIVTIEFERGLPCVRAIELVGAWDEGPWVGSRGGVRADSAVILRAERGQRLVGYDIARGDTRLECTLRRFEGAMLADE
ncbi:MAG: hypothetical protein U0269_36000 [Polyangiales bacterium]